jgi:hypothetical protein
MADHFYIDEKATRKDKRINRKRKVAQQSDAGGGRTDISSTDDTESESRATVSKLPIYNTVDSLLHPTVSSDSNNSSNVVIPTVSIQSSELKKRIDYRNKINRNGLGLPQLRLSDGTYYQGDWENGLMHGSGTHYDSNRRSIMYEGAWDEGRYHGFGRQYLSHSDHDWYEGDFVRGLREGNGKVTSDEMVYYDGAWKNGKMCKKRFYEEEDNYHKGHIWG